MTGEWWRQTGEFKRWVERWQAGPGMNDSNERTSEFLESLASGSSPAGFLGKMKEVAREQLDLRKAGLYSGFDGDVGEGWVPILDRLAADLVQLGWDRDLHQVKEKFGTLRFYIGAETPEMTERIGQAYDESARTCENCGAPGRIRRGGWLKTLCDGCERERQRGRHRE